MTLLALPSAPGLEIRMTLLALLSAPGLEIRMTLLALPSAPGLEIRMTLLALPSAPGLASCELEGMEAALLSTIEAELVCRGIFRIPRTMPCSLDLHGVPKLKHAQAAPISLIPSFSHT